MNKIFNEWKQTSEGEEFGTNRFWVRSPYKPDYAINLNPNSLHFGWVMGKGKNSNPHLWSECYKITAEDCAKLYKDELFNECHERLDILMNFHLYNLAKVNWRDDNHPKVVAAYEKYITSKKDFNANYNPRYRN